MGAGFGCGPDRTVMLHIYDLSGNRVVEHANKLFRSLGTGAFHAAVEVYGKEWSFGFCRSGTGVFSCPPKGCELHHYSESLHMGVTNVSRDSFEGLMEKLLRKWRGRDYDLLYKNCCHFCEDLCSALRVDPLPDWVNNLAGAGATLDRGFSWAVNSFDAADDTRTEAIIEAAKAGRIDARYRKSGISEARAWDLLAKVGDLHESYGVTATTSSIMKEFGRVATRTWSGGSITSEAAGQDSNSGDTRSRSASKILEEMGRAVSTTLSGRACEACTRRSETL